METLDLQIARKRIQGYEEDALIRQSAEAVDCMDCEEFLNSGIQAFRWLDRAEETRREAIYQGLVEFDPTVAKAIEALYLAWLRPCTRAEQWIANVQSYGHIPNNLDEFRQCCEEVRDRVERQNWLKLASTSRTAAFVSEPW